MSDLNWPAVGVRVRERMTERKVTTAELARVTALSPVTIRSIRRGTGPHYEHKLVAISAALGWPPQYLREVAAGKPPSAPVSPPARIERKPDSPPARFERPASQVTGLDEARA